MLDIAVWSCFLHVVQLNCGKGVVFSVWYSSTVGVELFTLRIGSCLLSVVELFSRFVQMNCETDFVARNTQFLQLVSDVSRACMQDLSSRTEQRVSHFPTIVSIFLAY